MADQKPDQPAKAKQRADEADRSPTSVQLLNEIQERLERLEGNLALRERRLERFEKEFQTAAAKLRTDRAALEKERQTLQQQVEEQSCKEQQWIELNAAELEQYRLKTEEQSESIREHEAKLREMTQQVASKKQPKNKRYEQLGDQEPQREAKKLQQELAATQRQCDERDQEIERLQRSLDEALAAAEAASVLAAATSESTSEMAHDAASRPTQLSQPAVPPSFTQKQRWALAISVFVWACLAVLGTAFIYEQKQPGYLITGGLSLPPGDHQTLTEALKAGATATKEYPLAHNVQFQDDVQAGLLRISLQTTDRDQGLEIINAVGHAIASDMRSAQTHVRSQPADRNQQRDRLNTRIHEIDRLLAAAASQPAIVPNENDKRVAAATRETLAERSRVAARIEALSIKLHAASASPLVVKVEPDQLQAALTANPMLQADIDALSRHKTEIARVIRNVIQSAVPLFYTVTKETAAADTYITQALQEDHDPDAKAQLLLMREAVRQWSKASANLQKSWQSHQAMVSSPDADPLKTHAKLVPVAETFLVNTGASLTKFYAAMDALGQGRDEITKRIVLRNRLSRDLQQTLDAREQLAVAVRQVLPIHNLELSAMLQRVKSLGNNARKQRAVIEESLRQEKSAAMRAQQQQQLAGYRTEREELIRKTGELDKKILETATQALAVLAQTETARSKLVSDIEWHQQRTNLLRQLLALHEATERELAETVPPVMVRYMPAMASQPVVSTTERLWQAMMRGTTPLLVFLLGLGLGWWLISARRSTQTMERYARNMKARSITSDESP